MNKTFKKKVGKTAQNFISLFKGTLSFQMFSETTQEDHLELWELLRQHEN